MRQAGRFSGPGQPYEGLVRKNSQGFKWTGEVRLIEKDLELPLHWKKPRRIFVNSMSDVWHEQVPDAWIDQIFAVMILAEALEVGHVFQLLTKRPERMTAYFAAAPWPRISAIAKARWNWHWGAGSRWYPEKVWLGASVENQATADERIPWLLQTPAAIRFVSYEPALGPVDLRQYMPNALWNDLPSWQEPEVDWVVCGGESGPRARPCDLGWLRSIIQQCETAGVAVFVKQLGARPWITGLQVQPPVPAHIYSRTDTTGNHPSAYELHGFRSKAAADPAEWPEDLRVQQWPNG